MRTEGSRQPTLVSNPADDSGFCIFAEQLIARGAASIREFECNLRLAYPNAVVHARELASERIVIWYVYREGHWVRPDRTPNRQEDASTMPDREDELRATESSIHRDAERVRTLEAEKSTLDPADPRIRELSQRVEVVAAGLHEKATAERELSEEIPEPD